MATRRDQLQSYQFLLQRVVSALVYRKTDPAQSPFRRAGGAIFAGIMLSVLALAITAVIGLFATGCGKTSDWKKGEAIIREKETGTLYVVLPTKKNKGNDQRQTLYEAANFASAALLVGTTEVYEIKSQSLRENEGVDMGTTVGILGAPNSVPKPKSISGSGWGLCTIPPEDDDGKAKSKLFVGGVKSKRPQGDKLGGTQAVVMTDGTDEYVIAGGLKHKVDNADGEDILRFLNAPDEMREADQAFIDGIESGEPLRVPDFGNADDDSAVDGQKVGTVIKESGSGTTKYWVAMKKGVAAITKVQADMITGKLGQAEIEEQNIANIDDIDPLKPSSDAAPPEKVSEFTQSGADKPVCAAYPPNGKRPSVLVSAELPTLNGVKTVQDSDSTAYADQIVVEPGTGAIAETGPQTDEGGQALITASGHIYGLSETKPSKETGTAAPKDAKSALGYGGEAKPPIVDMPSHVVDLIPEGPELNPVDAMRTVPGGGK